MPGNSRVLIVDDNADAAFVQAALVRLFGYDVKTCCRGSEALDAAIAFRPAVVLLDLAMPHVDGFDVLQQIRQQPELKTVYVVAISGYGAPSDREATAAAGFDLHLVKPAEPKALKATLDGVRDSLQV